MDLVRPFLYQIIRMLLLRGIPWMTLIWWILAISLSNLKSRPQHGRKLSVLDSPWRSTFSFGTFCKITSSLWIISAIEVTWYLIDVFYVKGIMRVLIICSYISLSLHPSGLISCLFLICPTIFLLMSWSSLFIGNMVWSLIFPSPFGYGPYPMFFGGCGRKGITASLGTRRWMRRWFSIMLSWFNGKPYQC